MATRFQDDKARQTRQRTRRGPGRPAGQSASGEQLRDAIVAAGARVYAERGYQGVTVEHILQASGVSRPTFYRYFKDRYDVIDVTIAEVNDQLRALVEHAVREAEGIEQLLEGVVDAYFEWGEHIGPLAGPLYREIHDPASPASVHRARLLRELMVLFTGQYTAGNGVTDEPLLYEAAMLLVEHVGHTTFWPKMLPVAERRRRRTILMRALRGILMASVPT